MKASAKLPESTMKIMRRNKGMVKTVKMTTSDTISIQELPAWNLEEWEKVIGADCTEVVKTQLMLDLFGEMVVMIVDESGLCKNLPKNRVASFLYGCGCPIAGDVIFGLLDGPDVLPPENADSLLQTLKFSFPLLHISGKEREGEA